MVTTDPRSWTHFNDMNALVDPGQSDDLKITVDALMINKYVFLLY